MILCIMRRETFDLRAQRGGSVVQPGSAHILTAETCVCVGPS